MAAQIWPIALSRIPRHEGGYVNHPQDPGGHTNLGIILRTLRAWQPNATVRDLKALTIKSPLLQKIYKRGYWDKCRCDDLPPGVDYVVFFAAINSGPSRAIRWLQRAIVVEPDGSFGPVTLSAAWKLHPETIIKRFAKDRLDWLRTLGHWATFGKGWSRRVNNVRAEGLAIAAAHYKKPTDKNPVLKPERSPFWWLLPLFSAISTLIVYFFT